MGAALVHDPLTRFFAQAVAIVVVSRVLGLVLRRIGQPQVIAEVIAGIVLGPSLLGAVAPGALEVLFAEQSLGALQLLSQVGLVLFMFLIGIELDPSLLRGRGQASLWISQAGTAVPFGLGVLLAFGVESELSRPDVPFVAFALFMGVAMAVTAFPVLARILSEGNLLTTRVGAMPSPARPSATSRPGACSRSWSASRAPRASAARCSRPCSRSATAP